MYENLQLDQVEVALADEFMIGEGAVDSPTTIPCGITISITIGC